MWAEQISEELRNGSTTGVDYLLPTLQRSSSTLLKLNPAALQ